MSHELSEGKQLKSVFWEHSELNVDHEYVGRGLLMSLTVREQLGQMSMVPWIEAVWEDGQKTLYNAESVHGVDLLEESADDKET